LDPDPDEQAAITNAAIERTADTGAIRLHRRREPTSLAQAPVIARLPGDQPIAFFLALPVLRSFVPAVATGRD
jgi:hypothetical protein